ncbi:MAG: bifunctional riboflavin kinase/FAD synthetase [Betaproteobacteria bacterium]|jgi:riboflavin kinase/FMN adenylyltransferase
MSRIEGKYAATIGNFDGVHVGHAHILEKLVSVAKERKLLAAVMIFEPQPLEYFSADSAPPRISTLREKLERFREIGVDAVFVIPFDSEFSSLSADAFIDRYLVELLPVEWLLVGDDFRFGKGRAGDFRVLRERGQEQGFEVEATDSITVAGVRVSSSVIREALKSGDFQKSQEFLGRSYNITARVVRGNALGRTFGFPTANLGLKNLSSPLSGIYLVRVVGDEIDERYGLASIGSRPTIELNGSIKVEIFILDFDGDLYGKKITVTVLSKLRDEKQFASVDEMITAMKMDEANARKLIAAGAF